MHLVKYYNVKFAQRVYKEADEYRSLSLIFLNANCNRKTARQDASAEKRYSIRPAGASAWYSAFVGACFRGLGLFPSA